MIQVFSKQNVIFNIFLVFMLTYYQYCDILNESVERPQLNWIEQHTTNVKVRGSSPCGRTKSRQMSRLFYFFVIKAQRTGRKEDGSNQQPFNYANYVQQRKTRHIKKPGLIPGLKVVIRQIDLQLISVVLVQKHKIINAHYEKCSTQYCCQFTHFAHL